MITKTAPTRRRRPARVLSVAIGIATLLTATVAGAASANSGEWDDHNGWGDQADGWDGQPHEPSVRTLRDVEAKRLARAIDGRGVRVRNVSFTGEDVQAGLFRTNAFGDDFRSGVALSTGSLIDADPQADSDVDFTSSSLLGPNESLTTTGDFGGAGDEDLTALVGATTYDAAVLTFTVRPQHRNLQLVYRFGSEEYANWSGQGWNDALAIWIDGQRCSTVPGTADAAGLATINASTNAQLYVANFDGNAPSTQYDTELNAFTTPLVCTASVRRDRPVTVKIAVADTRDGHLDTTLLIQARSLTSTRR